MYASLRFILLILLVSKLFCQNTDDNISQNSEDNLEESTLAPDSNVQIQAASQPVSSQIIDKNIIRDELIPLLSRLVSLSQGQDNQVSEQIASSSIENNKNNNRESRSRGISLAALGQYGAMATPVQIPTVRLPPRPASVPLASGYQTARPVPLPVIGTNEYTTIRPAPLPVVRSTSYYSTARPVPVPVITSSYTTPRPVPLPVARTYGSNQIPVPASVTSY